MRRDSADGWRRPGPGCNDLPVTRRHIGRASLRLAVAVGVFAVVGTWGGVTAGAAVPVTQSRTGHISTTTVPLPTTTVPPPTTAAPQTTVPQASTDSTPTAQKSGTVASDPAQKRLRWIIAGLVGLAVIVLIVTIWFWRATSPSRGVTVTEVATDEDGDGSVPAQPAIPTPAAAPGTPVDALPLMAVNAPLPSAGPPVATSATTAFVPTAAVPSPPPQNPADVYGTAPAPPDPPTEVAPDPQWFKDPEPASADLPDPPAFDEPDPPTFAEPDPPHFEESEPTSLVEAVADDYQDEDDDEGEVWEPRSTVEPMTGDGEQWRGIRPLGPVPRGE
jgi:hypothetical protein